MFELEASGEFGADLFARLELAIDVLEHQGKPFPVLQVEVSYGDVPLLRPVVWRPIVGVDQGGLQEERRVSLFVSFVRARWYLQDQHKD